MKRLLLFLVLTYGTSVMAMEYMIDLFEAIQTAKEEKTDRKESMNQTIVTSSTKVFKKKNSKLIEVLSAIWIKKQLEDKELKGYLAFTNLSDRYGSKRFEYEQLYSEIDGLTSGYISQYGNEKNITTPYIMDLIVKKENIYQIIGCPENHTPFDNSTTVFPKKKYNAMNASKKEFKTFFS